MKPSTPFARAQASPMLRTVNRGSAQDLAADKQEMAAVVIITLAALIVFTHLTRSFGLGVTPDSADYLSAAENLRHGRWFTQYDGRPLTLWPPLYPALLGIFSVIFSPMTAAKLLNGICLAGSSLFAWGWTRRLFGRAAGVSAAAGIALSTVLLMSCMVWTETLFIMLCLAALSSVDRFRSTGHGLYRAALFAALAGLTRYQGGLLIVAVALLVFAGPGRGRRAGDTVKFCLLAAGPLVLWLWRNLIVSGTLTGARHPADAGLVQTATETVLAVSRWAPGPHLVGLALIAAAVIVGIALIMLNLQEEKTSFVQALLLFGGLYAVSLVLTASWVAMDPVNGRLVAPLYPLALLLIVGGLASLPMVWPSGLARAVMAVGLLLLPVFFAAPVASTGAEILARGPGGYARPEFRESAVLAWLRAHPQPQPMVSNEPGSIYWLTGQAAYESPAAHPYRSRRGPADDPVEMAQAVGGTLVLFKQGEDRFLTADQLQTVVGLSPLADLTDGAVYRISPAP